jgi:hypothetical protein
MHPGSRRGSLPLIVAGMAIGAVIVGSALADSGTPPAGGYVIVSPATKVFGGTIGAGKGVSAIAIGGATTVPTNATAVEISLSIKSTQAGVLTVYPAGDPTAPDSQDISYSAGTTNLTAVGTVGVKDEITFHNAGSASATVGVKDIGYSTQLTATNIAPDGGSPGEVLTNTGSGAVWGPAGGASTADEEAPIYPLTTLPTTVATVNVGPGSYQVTYSGDVSNHGAVTDHVLCSLGTPEGSVPDEAVQLLPGQGATITVPALISTAGGTLTIVCNDFTSTSAVGQSGFPEFIATQVSSASGAVFSKKTSAAFSKMKK